MLHPDGTYFDVSMATCSVPVSCLFKMKYYHLRLNKARESEARRNPLGMIFYFNILCALVFADPVADAVLEIRSASATERSAFFSTQNSALHCTGSIVSKSNSSLCLYGKLGFLEMFFFNKRSNSSLSTVSSS